MAETPSNMLPLGTLAPDFTLPDVCSGTALSLQELKSDIATVIMFICNHCPYVKRIQSKLVEVVDTYKKLGIHFIAINSNDAVHYLSDSPVNMKIQAEENQYSFPYLYDETQAIAKAYQAACTPDFYIFDANLHCVYRGRFDDATPGNQHPATGKELCAALDAIISKRPIDTNQKPSVGCNIKWKK